MFAGNLHFAYAKVSDTTTGDLVYKCQLNNPFLDQKVGSCYTKVIVESGGTEILFIRKPP